MRLLRMFSLAFLLFGGLTLWGLSPLGSDVQPASAACSGPYFRVWQNDNYDPMGYYETWCSPTNKPNLFLVDAPQGCPIYQGVYRWGDCIDSYKFVGGTCHTVLSVYKGTNATGSMKQYYGSTSEPNASWHVNSFYWSYRAVC